MFLFFVVSQILFTFAPNKPTTSKSRMTRKLLFVVAFFALLVAQPVAAGDGARFGFRGGVNLTDLNFDHSILSENQRCGWFIGPTLKFSTPLIPLCFDLAALFEQRETKLNGSVVRQNSIIVPANLRLQFGLSRLLGLYVAAGPQLGLNVGKEKFTFPDDDGSDNAFWLKRTNFSINLGAGIYLTRHVEVGLAYNIALGKTGNVTFNKAFKTLTNSDTYSTDSQAKTWMLTAALYF
jgi:hypothetical protein